MTDITRKLRANWSTWVMPLVVLCMLAGVAAEWRWMHSPTSDTKTYHEKVRQAATAVAEQVGDWKSRDTEVPQAAVNMLKPNVLLSKLWFNESTGQHVSMLIVQCRDARDILGHYPPVCYVGQGWSIVRQERRRWSAGGFEIEGTEYTMGRTVLEGPSRLIIQNFMVLPDGRFAPDMEAVDKIASNRHLKFLGAAQVQLVYDDRMTPEQREEVLERLVTAHGPLLQSILSGVDK
jgi:hypothetical protein